MYSALKHLHVACVVVSGIGFLLRGVWMLRESPQPRWAGIAPHIVDTLLLGSAVALALASGQYPFVAPWLTAKFLGLLAYIGLGTIALRRGRTRTTRGVALVAALAVFAYIVSVALTRDPRGFLLLAGA